MVISSIACDAPTSPVFDNPVDDEYIGPRGPTVAWAWSTGVRLSWAPGTEPLEAYVVERAPSFEPVDETLFEAISGPIRDQLSFADSALTDLRSRRYRIRGIGKAGPLHSSVLTVEYPRYTLPLLEKEYPTAIAFSADGQLVATSHINLEYDPHPGSVVRIWDVARRQEIHRFRSRNVASESSDVREAFLPMAFSPDGRYLVLAGYAVDVFDLKEDRRSAEFFPEGYGRPRHIAFHPGGRQVGLLLGSHGLTLDVRRLADGTQVSYHYDSDAASAGHILDASFDGDGSHFVVAFEETIRTWSVGSWTLESTLVMPSPMAAAKIGEDGQRIVSWNGPSLHIWDRARNGLERVLPLDSDPIIQHVSVNDDLSLFATGSIRPGDWNAPYSVSVYRLDGSHFRTLPPLHNLRAFVMGPSHVFAFWERENATWSFDEIWHATAVTQQ